MQIEIVEFFSIALFFISFFGLIVSRKAVKSIVFILIMQTAVVMFFLSIGYSEGIMPPIGESLENPQYAADPLPQALMLTAIIIAISVVAVSITMLMTLFRKYNTTDWDTLKNESKR